MEWKYFNNPRGLNEMASITSYPSADQPNASRVIQFLFAGKRRTVSLGKMKLEKAEAIKAKIEFILQDNENGQAHDTETLRWIKGIGDKFHSKLSRVGLIPARPGETKLGPFIEAYIAKRPNAKPATKAVWRQGQNGLI